MSVRSFGIGDIVLALAMLGVAAVFFAKSFGLPASDLDSLGSAAVPRGISAVIAVCALIVLVRALVALRQPSTAAPASFPLRPDLVMMSGLICLVYILAMSLEVVKFRVATGLFVASLGGLLCDFRPREMIAVLLIAITSSFGIHYLFSALLGVELP